MWPKKSRVARTVLATGIKQEIIAKGESGPFATPDIRRYLMLLSCMAWNRFTVGTVLAKKGLIKKVQAAKGVTKISFEKPWCFIHEKKEIAFSFMKEI
ncbi:hypothetical protein AVEN_55827-1 [Araneus ventricosus]|uniref:Uncharacterized protein n=1 Tax=Araneus ventricosus TaxID=182803 RepID=A0A4Y2CMT8_ARAVE|nr:hypothetical protein AVEN_55827-1 [Araneus ventricosus]